LLAQSSQAFLHQCLDIWTQVSNLFSMLPAYAAGIPRKIQHSDHSASIKFYCSLTETSSLSVCGYAASFKKNRLTYK
jgi:hypothetical protein